MTQQLRQSSFDAKSSAFNIRKKSRKETLCKADVQIMFAISVKPIAWQSLGTGAARFIKDFGRRGYFIEVTNTFIWNIFYTE